jgi:hypothetical protein
MSSHKIRDHAVSFVNASQTNAQNFPMGGNTLIRYDTELNDLLDEYDPTVTYFFTPKRTGLYLVNASVSVAATVFQTVNIIRFNDTTGGLYAHNRKDTNGLQAFTNRLTAVLNLVAETNYYVSLQCGVGVNETSLVAGIESQLNLMRLR